MSYREYCAHNEITNFIVDGADDITRMVRSVHFNKPYKIFAHFIVTFMCPRVTSTRTYTNVFFIIATSRDESFRNTLALCWEMN